VALCPARAEDAEDVKKKLFEAKKTYDGEAQKFRKSIADFLDKREEEARKTGNKKLLDQTKAERTAFEKQGELPEVFPMTTHAQMKAARANLDKAYTTAVKYYVRAKDDSTAEALEKEQQKFFVDSALLFGKRTYVATLRAFNVIALENRENKFEK